MLKEEVHLLKKLRHPNVLLTMGIAMGDTPGIVMEHMQASLLDVITLPFFKMVNKWDSALLSIASDVSKGMSNAARTTNMSLSGALNTVKNFPSHYCALPNVEH
mgnify:CR=1 FL=1